MKTLDLISVGTGAITFLYSDRSLEIRTPKKEFFFRGRDFENCEGTDFWDVTEKEKTELKEMTRFEELGHLGGGV